MPGRTGKKGRPRGQKVKGSKETKVDHTVAQKDNPHYQLNTTNAPSAEEELAKILKQLRKRGIVINIKEHGEEVNHLANLVVEMRREISDIEVSEDWPLKMDSIKKAVNVLQALLDRGFKYEKGDGGTLDLENLLAGMRKEISDLERPPEETQGWP